MKWSNRGHEYDETYSNIQSKESFYLFGAGDYGTQFIGIFRDEIKINGYIDNDPGKQHTEVNGYPCISFDEAPRDEKVGIILTISQFARSWPLEQLRKAGYRRNVDFFVIEEFLSVYFVYKYDQVYLSSISFLPSTVCNLKCRHCLNFNPFAEKFYVREWDALVRDVDLFFSCVDRLMLFHLSGGEPMLYPHTADLIEYIDGHYGDRIDTFRTVTNGTVVPEDDVLRKLAKTKVVVTVDDYREAVPRLSDSFTRLLRKFEEFGVKYYVEKVEGWVDLAPEKTDYSAMPEEWLIGHRASCGQSWEELRDGKLYSCNYAAYATVAGLTGEQDLEESFDLTSFTPERKKELVEFRLGYTTKGYTNFCKKCRGFTPENAVEVPPAMQV